MDPDVDFTQLDDDGDRAEAKIDSTIGIGVALERRFSSRIGFELGIMHVEPDLVVALNFASGLVFDASDDVGFTALTAGLNIHLTPSKAIDFYIGPLIGYAFFGDIQINGEVAGISLGETFRSDDEFVFGGQIGADIPLGSRSWSLNLAAQYLDASLNVTDEAGQQTALGFNPLMLSFGFGYSF